MENGKEKKRRGKEEGGKRKRESSFLPLLYLLERRDRARVEKEERKEDRGRE